MLKILVVEDNMINQKILGAFITRFKMDYSIAVNAADAIRKIEEEDFDCILMDISLPDANGIETSAKIREKENLLGIHTPIVAVTASVYPGDKERILESGIDYYLPKPVNENALFEILQKIYTEKISRENYGNFAGPGITSQQNTIQVNIIDKALFVENFHYFDKETVLEIIDLYLDEYPERIQKLEIQIMNSNLTDARNTSHGLKGVISNFAAPALLDLIRRIEEDCRNDISENLQPMFKEFTRLGELMIEELRVIRTDYV
jgi:CheY-like chemotaxis protein/HPt (histidine-containing phosphotransfer) domain-containing protein